MIGDLASQVDADLAALGVGKSELLGVAVSGGSDSLALLMTVHKTGRPLHVFTVDHQLRSESADEALFVAQISETLGCKHTILNWSTPRKGQAHARRARHLLLANASRTFGCKMLLLGHTMDDVIETALMRHRRTGHKVTSVGPMPVCPSPVWPEGRGLTLYRPVLAQRRETLRTFLRNEGLKWVDDPSNNAPQYERSRTRNFLQRHPALSADLPRIISKLLTTRYEHERQIGAFLQSNAVKVRSDGQIEVECPGSTFAQATPNWQLSALSLLTQAAGGHANPARANKVREIVSSLDRKGQRATINGAWLQRTNYGFALGRDPAIKAKNWSEDDIWDGRYTRAAFSRPPETSSYLVRASMPPDHLWQEIISERLAHIAKIYQTPLNKPVVI